MKKRKVRETHHTTDKGERRRLTNTETHKHTHTYQKTRTRHHQIPKSPNTSLAYKTSCVFFLCSFPLPFVSRLLVLHAIVLHVSKGSKWPKKRSEKSKETGKIKESR